MTNYNERLDEIIRFVNIKGYVGGDNKLRSDITSLIKELVAEAKPYKKPQFFCQGCDKSEERGHNHAIDEFEQNLLKALEEV